MDDSIQTIRLSSYRFFSGTFLSRLTGMVRDMSMAYVFGTQPSIAAFMVAYRFAHMLRRLLGEGALQSTFIPEFESLRHHQEQRAFIFFRDLIFVLTLLLLFIIGIGSIILSFIISKGLLQPKYHEVSYQTLIMLPSLLFICLFGLNSSFLQCEKIYFIPSVAPVAFNLIWIATLFYLKDLSAQEAMPWLSFGVVVACFFQWLLTMPQTMKNLKLVLSHAIWPSFRFDFTDIHHFIKPLSLGILGVAASQINNMIDTLFAFFAQANGPALLWYAIRIQQLPLALFGITIGSALLPPLARAIKAQRWKEYHQFLHDAFERTLFFLLPISAILFIMGDVIIQFLFGRGDFGPQSVIETTYCLWAYGVGLLPSTFVLILAPACYAQNNYSFPTMAAFITMFLNTILNSFFIFFLDFGTISVAVATSISSWINFFLLKWNLSKTTSLQFPQSFFLKGMKIFFVTLVSLWGTFKFRSHFLNIPLFSDSLLFSTFIEQVYFLSSQMLFFGAIFLLGYFILFAREKLHFLKI